MSKKPVTTTAIKPRTSTQGALLKNLNELPLTFAIGPAGTGKSYISTRVGCSLLQDGIVSKFIVTRPIIEAEEKLGFLPGTFRDKVAPYFLPIREIMIEHFGPVEFNRREQAGEIEFAPLAYMRGRTFKHCFVLLDEAQNTTRGQMKLFLTRLGEGARACVDGDTDQSDLPGPNGLDDALKKLKDIEGINCFQFSVAEVVRSDLVKKIIEAYA